MLKCFRVFLINIRLVACHLVILYIMENGGIMKFETHLARTTDAVGERAQYDDQVKELLANKNILHGLSKIRL